MGLKNPPESAVFPGTPTTTEPIPASVVGSPLPTSPPFGDSWCFGIPRLRLGYTTATISEGFLEWDPLNHPFMDGFSTINRPAIGGAPWLWKPRKMTMILMDFMNFDGCEWIWDIKPHFGMSCGKISFFRCPVGRLAWYCDKFGIVLMDLGRKGRYRINKEIIRDLFTFMVNTIRKVLANGRDHLPAALFFRFKIDSFLATQCYLPNAWTYRLTPREKIEKQNPEPSLLYKAIKYN